MTPNISMTRSMLPPTTTTTENDGEPSSSSCVTTAHHPTLDGSTTTKCPPPPRRRERRSSGQHNQHSRRDSSSAGVISLNELASVELEKLGQAQTIVATKASISSSSSSTSPRANSTTNNQPLLHKFPTACRAVIQQLDGNSTCVDCASKNPEWAALSYGALICVNCAGYHRSLGVNVSKVRSMTMDHWSYPDIIKMFEGGNAQLSNFFHRHHLTSEALKKEQSSSSPSTTPPSSVPPTVPTPRPLASSSASSSDNSKTTSITIQNCHKRRYKTKAGQFYRNHLHHHVSNLLAKNPDGIYQGRKQRRLRGRQPIGRNASGYG